MNKKKVLGNISKLPDTPEGFIFDKIKNKNINNNYSVRFTIPEFTSICPVTKQPDFATIILDYIPNNWLVESKSLKIYIQAFRNYGIFHEDATLLIGNSLIKQIKPKWIRLGGFFAPRGGIPIDVFWQKGKIPENTLVSDINNYRKKKL